MGQKEGWCGNRGYGHQDYAKTIPRHKRYRRGDPLYRHCQSYKPSNGHPDVYET